MKKPGAAWRTYPAKPKNVNPNATTRLHDHDQFSTRPPGTEAADKMKLALAFKPLLPPGRTR